jgi:hypothetical protein
MYDHRPVLRDAAKSALVTQGFRIQEEKRDGARLVLIRKGKTLSAAVRTSANRRVGWMRDAKGAWRAMREADLVVVAAFENAAVPSKIDVFGFQTSDVRSAFDERLKRNKEKNPDFASGAPVFVSLDPPERGRSSAGKDLQSKALWHEVISLEGNRVDRDDPLARELANGLTIAAAKEGLAKTYGVTPASIEIIIRG